MIFWTPRLSAMIRRRSVVLMSSSSTLWGDPPSLLLCAVAVERAGWSFGMRRRLVPDFLRDDLRMRPVFWTSRAPTARL